MRALPVARVNWIIADGEESVSLSWIVSVGALEERWRSVEGDVVPRPTLPFDWLTWNCVEVEAALNASPNIASEIDAMGRARARAEREADAEQRLAELKRRMGK